MVIRQEEACITCSKYPFEPFRKREICRGLNKILHDEIKVKQ